MRHPLPFLLFLAAVLNACSVGSKYQMTTQRDMNALTRSVSFNMPQVPVPSFTDRTFSVIDYGADPTGIVLSTEAIQKAIDDCTETGGGTVIIPEGLYTTGPITLKSNVRLYTEHNCFITFSNDFDLYEIQDVWFEGEPDKRCISPINARHADNIAITGHGVFNGNGDWWRPLKKAKMAETQWKKHLKEKGGFVTEKNVWNPDSCAFISSIRPVLLHFVNCKNILLEGVTFENSPAWNLHPMCCENLILNNVNVRNPWYSQNGDGVDVESCRNVVISHCSFDVGDDAICMKSGKDKPGRDRAIPTENVIVDDCTVYHGHGGFVCGSEMSGGIKNVEVRNNLYIGTDVGLRFKSVRGRGGVVENIFIRGINMVNIPNEGLLFDLYYGGKGSGEETEEELAARMQAEAPVVSEETPAFRNITIEDVKGTNIQRAIFFNGLPEMKIQNVTLRNISIAATQGALFRQTDGLVIDNVHIVPIQGQPFIFAPSVEHIQIK